MLQSFAKQNKIYSNVIAVDAKFQVPQLSQYHNHNNNYNDENFENGPDSSHLLFLYFDMSPKERKQINSFCQLQASDENPLPYEEDHHAT